ncbi:MAG: phosphatidyl-myo-inositol alpha-mannosyltransferase [Thermoleophilaceae bacterium]|jgi:phosphatidylinositol alpha-mannosyltransferase|nr:phosphatidyl-myo-inositol alpha-mannosyltransferase [Thermoleophilaceae bacterium]
MHIALLHPTYWPDVRRGAERLVHDLAGWLHGAGHEVTIVTTHRARTEERTEEGVRVVRAWRPPDRLMRRRAYEEHLGTIPAQMRSLLGVDADVAHAFFPVSAWAAVQARRLGGPPVVFSAMGVPTRRYLVWRRYRLGMQLEAAREAAAVSVLSEAAAEAFRRYLLRTPEVVPPGVRCADFEGPVERPDEPTIVYSGSPADPRKRVPLLFEAFTRLRRRVPRAQLLMAGRPEPWFELDLPEGARWISGDATDDLARILRTAHLAVLPAIEEGFGLVLVEALAAGTPVVAARSGAGPEVVSDERIGRLFEPDDADDLAAVLEQGLELGADQAVIEACRAHARRWDWSVVGPRWERLAARAVERA